MLKSPFSWLAGWLRKPVYNLQGKKEMECVSDRVREAEEEKAKGKDGETDGEQQQSNMSETIWVWAPQL